MPLIEKSSQELAAALGANQSITITKNGKWHLDGMFIRFIRWLFDLEQSHLKKISYIFAKLLDGTERRPLFFQADPITSARQVEYFSSYINVAEALTHRISRQKNAKISNEINILTRKVVALKYRIEATHGGADKIPIEEIDLEKKNRLIKIAEKWKKNQLILIGTDRLLHPLDLDKIEEVCRYPLFLEILLKDAVLQRNFFSWTLKNCNGVQAFVEYPGLFRRLKTVFLAGRLGRFAYANPLSTKKKCFNPGTNIAYTQKVVRLVFEGQKVNILDERKVVRLRSDYYITINDIFEDMSQRNKRQSKFEFFGERGICNWRSDCMGYWNPHIKKWTLLNLRGPRWWEALPPLEKITKDKLMKRYNIAEISRDQCLIAALAARQSTDASIVNCHGYTEILIPDKKGLWSVYPFGKFAKKWPGNCLESIGMIGDTTKADYIYPDPNIFYSGFRQQAALPFVVTEEECIQYMNDHVRDNILKGREGNLVFMLGYENCAYSIQDDLESVLGKTSEGGRVPNLFLSDFFDCQLSGPMRPYFKVLKEAPRCISAPLKSFTRFILGTWRSIKVLDKSGKHVKKSLSSSPFNKGVDVEIDGRMQKVYHYIFHPSHLHKQIIDNNIYGGLIWGGHQRYQ